MNKGINERRCRWLTSLLHSALARKNRFAQMIYCFSVVNGVTQEEANDLDMNAPLLTEDLATANKTEICAYSHHVIMDTHRSISFRFISCCLSLPSRARSLFFFTDQCSFSGQHCYLSRSRSRPPARRHFFSLTRRLYREVEDDKGQVRSIILVIKTRHSSSIDQCHSRESTCSSSEV